MILGYRINRVKVSDPDSSNSSEEQATYWALTDTGCFGDHWLPHTKVGDKPRTVNRLQGGRGKVAGFLRPG